MTCTFHDCSMSSFPKQLEVFLPNCSCLQDALSSTPPPYYTSHLSLSHFLQPHLLTQYFHAGEKCPIALTVGRRIDVECVFALTPSGVWLLHNTICTRHFLLQPSQALRPSVRMIVWLGCRRGNAECLAGLFSHVHVILFSCLI